MATLRFLPQTTLDGWLEQSKADLRAGALVDLGCNAQFSVREAVHFVKLESGDDVQQLLQKVKTVDQLKAMGADQCSTSVIVGDTVYEVVPGWLAEEPTAASAAVAAPAEPKPAAAPLPAATAARKRPDGKNAEADMLAQLLLDKLT